MSECKSCSELRKENEMLRQLNQLLNQKVNELRPESADITSTCIHLTLSSTSSLSELQLENRRLRDLNIALNSKLLEIEKELKDIKEELNDVNIRLKEVEWDKEEREFMYFISDCVKEFHDGFFEINPKSQNQKRAFFKRLNKAHETLDLELSKNQGRILSINRLFRKSLHLKPIFQLNKL